MTLNHLDGLRKDMNAPLDKKRAQLNDDIHEVIIHITRHKAALLTSRDLGLGVDWV